MNKLIVSIIVISLLIISTALQINALETNQEDILNSSSPEHFKIYENGNIETDYLSEDILFSSEGGPDLIILGLATCWGYNFYHDCDAIYVKFYVRNVGDTYVHYDENGEPATIQFYVYLFADDETSPFGGFVFTPWYGTRFEHWETLGRNWDFLENELNGRPDTITIKVDYTNVIPESDETNNVESCDVVSAINVSGYVYDRNINGGLTPIAGCEILQGQGPPINDQGERPFFTTSEGYYNTIFYPAEPADQPHTYNLVAEAPVPDWQMKLKIKKWQIKTLPDLMPGDDIRVDFIFEGNQPIKPFIPVGKRVGIAGKSYTFRTAAFDLDGDELYYLFDWGDGTYSYWLGPYKSGEFVEASHTYNNGEFIHIYEIRVLAKDSHDTLSKFSFISLLSIFSTKNN